MRIISVLLLVFAYFTGDVIAATRPTGRNARGGAATTTTQTAAPKATSARAARVSPQASAGAKPVSARAARTPAATASTGAKPVVAARAGTTQKVISSGTKVATAAKNLVVAEGCQEKYDGCMDSFCMLDNETGGRCICSDRNAELDSILAEIEKLDQQSYQMATFGVEKLEMGAMANDAIAAANAAAAEAASKIKEEERKKERKSLDLSMWDMSADFEEEDDLFGDSVNISPVEGKEGDELHKAAARICIAQIPECKNDLSMLQLMYAQRIKSDCAAYENSLKQQKNASQQKLNAAERALRETALEQLQMANKYDLGQCTVEFKKCMQTTGGCGDDFAGCASVSAMDNTSTRKSTSKSVKSYKIKGAVTTIEISASTYDALAAKKPLCESVTKSCVAVADQVWDTFLREVAPQVKSAELIAEDNARQNCIGNISSCFQKACKDNMDPNDPDGSYDMCLSRPGTMLNVCKVPLNNCGIDASSEEKAAESNIWDFVVARLAAMRVDSCTTEVKECLQAEDRCGEDYTQCIGLDTDSIIRMCPYDKLTGCQKIYGEDEIRGDAVYDELATMVQGIMLNIDNNFLTECQNAANEAMIKVCGDTEDCSNLTVDDNIGARSLEYKICEYKSSGQEIEYNAAKCYPGIDNVPEADLRNGVALAGILSGMIFWEEIDYDNQGILDTVEDYLSKTKMTVTDAERQLIKTEVGNLQDSINRVVSAIESDPKVQFCINGREVQGMTRTIGEGKEKTTSRTKIGEKSTDAARFPELTKQMRMIIANAALSKARDNYYDAYDEKMTQLNTAFSDLSKRISELSDEDNAEILRESGRIACLGLAKKRTQAQYSFSPSGANQGNGITVTGTALNNATLIYPYTDGTSSLVGMDEMQKKAVSRELAAEHYRATLRLQQKTKVSYNWDTRVCHKCIENRVCTKVKHPWFSSAYCDNWAEPKETCSDIQY